MPFGKTDNPNWVSGRRTNVWNLKGIGGAHDRQCKLGQPKVPVMPQFYQWLMASRPDDHGKGPTGGREKTKPWRWRAIAFCALQVGGRTALEVTRLTVADFRKIVLPVCAWRWLGRWLRWRYIMRGPGGGIWVASHIAEQHDSRRMMAKARVILNGRKLPPWTAKQFQASRWPFHANLQPGWKLRRDMIGSSLIRGD